MKHSRRMDSPVSSYSLSSDDSFQRERNKWTQRRKEWQQKQEYDEQDVALTHPSTDLKRHVLRMQRRAERAAAAAAAAGGSSNAAAETPPGEFERLFNHWSLSDLPAREGEINDIMKQLAPLLLITNERKQTPAAAAAAAAAAKAAANRQRENANPVNSSSSSSSNLPRSSNKQDSSSSKNKKVSFRDLREGAELQEVFGDAASAQFFLSAFAAALAAAKKKTAETGEAEEIPVVPPLDEETDIPQGVLLPSRKRQVSPLSPPAGLASKETPLAAAATAAAAAVAAAAGAGRIATGGEKNEFSAVLRDLRNCGGGKRGDPTTQSNDVRFASLPFKNVPLYTQKRRPPGPPTGGPPTGGPPGPPKGGPPGPPKGGPPGPLKGRPPGPPLSPLAGGAVLTPSRTKKAAPASSLKQVFSPPSSAANRSPSGSNSTTSSNSKTGAPTTASVGGKNGSDKGPISRQSSVEDEAEIDWDGEFESEGRGGDVDDRSALRGLSKTFIHTEPEVGRLPSSSNCSSRNSSTSSISSNASSSTIRRSCFSTFILDEEQQQHHKELSFFSVSLHRAAPQDLPLLGAPKVPSKKGPLLPPTGAALRAPKVPSKKGPLLPPTGAALRAPKVPPKGGPLSPQKGAPKEPPKRGPVPPPKGAPLGAPKPGSMMAPKTPSTGPPLGVPKGAPKTASTGAPKASPKTASTGARKASLSPKGAPKTPFGERPNLPEGRRGFSGALNEVRGRMSRAFSGDSVFLRSTGSDAATGNRAAATGEAASSPSAKSASIIERLFGSPAAGHRRSSPLNSARTGKTKANATAAATATAATAAATAGKETAATTEQQQQQQEQQQQQKLSPKLSPAAAAAAPAAAVAAGSGHGGSVGDVSVQRGRKSVSPSSSNKPKPKTPRAQQVNRAANTGNGLLTGGRLYLDPEMMQTFKDKQQQQQRAMEDLEKLYSLLKREGTEIQPSPTKQMAGGDRSKPRLRFFEGDEGDDLNLEQLETLISDHRDATLKKQREQRIKQEQDKRKKQQRQQKDAEGEGENEDEDEGDIPPVTLSMAIKSLKAATDTLTQTEEARKQENEAFSRMLKEAQTERTEAIQTALHQMKEIAAKAQGKQLEDEQETEMKIQRLKEQLQSKKEKEQELSAHIEELKAFVRGPQCILLGAPPDPRKAAADDDAEGDESKRDRGPSSGVPSGKSGAPGGPPYSPFVMEIIEKERPAGSLKELLKVVDSVSKLKANEREEFLAQMEKKIHDVTEIETKKQILQNKIHYTLDLGIRTLKQQQQRNESEYSNPNTSKIKRVRYYTYTCIHIYIYLYICTCI